MLLWMNERFHLCCVFIYYYTIFGGLNVIVWWWWWENGKKIERRRERECKRAVNRNESQCRKLHEPCSLHCVCVRICVSSHLNRSDIVWKFSVISCINFSVVVHFTISSSFFGSYSIAIVTVFIVIVATHQYHHRYATDRHHYRLTVRFSSYIHVHLTRFWKCCTEMRRNHYYHYYYDRRMCTSVCVCFGSERVQT